MFCIFFLRISFELLLTSLHEQFLYTGYFSHVLHLDIKLKVKLNYMVFNGDRPWQSLWHAGLLGLTLYRSFLSHSPYFLWPLYVDTYWRAERAHLVLQLAWDFHYRYMYLTMHFGPGTARALRANITGLASSACHNAYHLLVNIPY